MVLGTWLGWKFINDPKLVYFSNRFDRPHGEFWAGLCMALFSPGYVLVCRPYLHFTALSAEASGSRSARHSRYGGMLFQSVL
jgi:hypothetical protein